VKFIRNTFFGIIALIILSLPIVLYLANIEKINTIAIIMSVIFYVISIVLVFIFYYSKLKNNNNPFVVPVVFIISPALFYMEFSSMRLFFDINSCPAGWEIIIMFPALFYSLPLFIITAVVSVIVKLKLKK